VGDDDNPDHWQPWQRAVWLIHARHGIIHDEKLADGIKGNPAEIPLDAVRGLIVDLMHYVHERNKVFEEDDFLHFDEVVDDAHEQFIREREAIPDKDPEHMQIGHHAPMDRADPGMDALRQDLAKRHLAAFDALSTKHVEEIKLDGPTKHQDQRHHKEFRELALALAEEKERSIHQYRVATSERSESNTQGAAAAATAENDPKLAKLLTDLQNRQAGEANALLKRQEGQPFDPSGQELERDAQARKFEEERQRYIRQYNKGRELSQQLDADEKQKGLDHGHGLEE
jgi:hypothetical protein